MTSRIDQAGFRPDYAISPGDTLADLLDERSMTQTEVARRLGVSLKHVNQIVNGGAPLSVDIALGLEKVLGVSTAFWLNRDALYQAAIARREELRELEKSEDWSHLFPVKDLRSRGFIPREAKGSDLVAALLRFFGIASPKQWIDPLVAFRKSQKFESNPHALSTWLRVGELEASAINCQPYDPDQFSAALRDIRALTPKIPGEWQPQLVEMCAAVGVAVVLVDTFPGARVNGATRWLSPGKALIQLSLRHRWEDVFWFTFFHEAGHVLLHRKKDIFIESTRSASDDWADSEWSIYELEADRFAARTLIEPQYNGQLEQLALGDIPAFADRLGIAPAIIVGRLQHDRVLSYTQGNQLRRRFVFAE